MSFGEAVADIFVGALIGAMGGLFGVAGGIIAIPALVLMCGMQQQTAEGTALVTIAANVPIGLWAYTRRDRLDGRIALTLAAAGTIFRVAFAALALGWDGHILGRAFAAFLIATAAWVSAGLGLEHRLGAIGGALSGVFGIGGASITPPLMTALFGVCQMAAQGYAIGDAAAVPAGVALAHRLPQRTLKRFFAAMIPTTSAVLIVKYA